MKIYKILSFLIGGVAVVLTGCEQDATNLQPTDITSKLVVISYISPQDTMLAVQLQKTQPAIGKRLIDEQLKVTNATVTMSDGSSVVALAYNPERNQYEADARSWPIVAGKTYKLNVQTPAGAKAEASCTVPSADGIEITEINTPYTIVQDYSGSNVRKYNVTFKWRDAPGIENYYRTLAYRKVKITNPDGYSWEQSDGLYMRSNNMGVLTDEKAKSGILTSEELEYYEYNTEYTGKPFQIYAVLVVSDRNYYLFHQSLGKQEEFDGNPFAEPTQMYTNVKGGLGVFAGYNQVVAVKEVE